MTLYEMSEAAKQLYEMLQDEEIDEDVVNDTLESMDVGSKLENYCKLIRQFYADALALKLEEAKLKQKRERAENAVERLSNNIIYFLQSTNHEKEKAGMFTVSVRKSEVVKISNLEQVPESYLRTKKIVEPDKIMIKNALKAGIPVAGAEIMINKKVNIQ